MWHFISLQPTHSYCRRFPTHSANYYGSVYVNRQNQLIKKSLNRQVKNFVNRQSQIYIKLRVSIYVFNLPKHFTLSVRFDLNTTTLAKFSELVNKKNQCLCIFFSISMKNSIKSMIYAVNYFSIMYYYIKNVMKTVS